MMFKTALVAAVVTLLGSTMALPYQQEVKLAIRDISVIGVRSIPAQVPEIMVRGEHVKRAEVEERQVGGTAPVDPDNSGTVPFDSHGPITPYPGYRKRQEIGEEIPVKSDNGVITPYSKRSIPAEVAVKSDGGDPVAYPKRGIPAEVAVKSDGGDPVAYPKRQVNVIPAEQATKSENGVISLY